MSQQQIVHLVMVVLFLSLSAIGAGIKKFREYRARQEARAAAERRRESVLRTGRADAADAASVMAPVATPVSSHDEARRKLIELARQRQGQLAEAARRPPVGARPAQAPARSGPTLPPPPPLGPPTRGPGPAMGRAAQAEEQRKKAEKRARAEEQRRRAQQAQEERARALAAEREAQDRRRAEAEAAGSTGPDGSEAGAGARRAAPAAAIAALRIGPGGPGDAVQRWRNAIMLQEVLARPLAERDE